MVSYAHRAAKDMKITKYSISRTCGAVMPLRIVHALVSVGPEVKYVCSPSLS